jgi:hypothetical protein
MRAVVGHFAARAERRALPTADDHPILLHGALFYRFRLKSEISNL